MFKVVLPRPKSPGRLILGLCTLLLLVQPAASEDVQLVQSRGVYMVPVRINGAFAIPFVLDSGAADISVPEDVFKTLIRTGTVAESDFLRPGTYVTADGSEHLSPRFVLHELRVGNHVINNVIAHVAPDKADPLLGQSFLQKLPTWTMDNTRHVLVFGTSAPTETAAISLPSAAAVEEDLNSRYILTPSAQCVVQLDGRQDSTCLEAPFSVLVPSPCIAAPEICGYALPSEAAANRISAGQRQGFK
jgi:clan AA aspartic protease (TIGR02281 family)